MGLEMKLPKIFFLCIGLFISGEIIAAARAPMAIPAITLIHEGRHVNVMNVEGLVDLKRKARTAFGVPQDSWIEFIMLNTYALNSVNFEAFRTSSEMPGAPRPRLEVLFL